MAQVAFRSRSRKPYPRSASVAPSPGAPDPAELRRLAAALRSMAAADPARGALLRVADATERRAERAEAGATWASLAAEGDTSAQSVVAYLGSRLCAA